MTTIKSKLRRKSDAAHTGTTSVQATPANGTLEGLGLPRRIYFDRNGTKDIGIICESDDDLSEIATSRMFWLPEYEHDAIPGTLRVLRLMVAAPELFKALQSLLDSISGIKLSKGQMKARNMALAAIAEASSQRKPSSRES